MKDFDYSRQTFYLFLFFAVILSGVILKVTASFSLPLTIAVLLSCVFYPIVKNLNRKIHLPWIAGIIIMATLFVILILLLSTIIGTSLSTIYGQYPKYESRFLSIYKVFAEKFHIQFYDDKSFVENMWSQLKVREFVQTIALAFSGNVISFTKNLMTILLFCVFLLIEMKTGTEKIYAIAQVKLSDRIRRIIRKVIIETVNYISIKFFISLITGLLVFLLLAILRLDFAIMWAFLAFVMNFIPTFGSIISVGLTTLFALLQFYPSPFPIIFILVMMTVINMVLGNIVEPRIEGKNLGLSPFVILVSLTFWGWMWGFVGMILAVPIMVILKIICENVSYLHGIAILLGNKPTETQKELSSSEE